MLRLLLDEHLSPVIARQFRVKWPAAEIESVLLWKDGLLAGTPDDVLLAHAHQQGWTLVTYDLSTIVPLLKSWTEQDISHGGVILVDERTIPPIDVGGLISALGLLWQNERAASWTDAVIYLNRPPRRR